MNRENVLYYTRIAGTLLVITACIALILGVVNYATVNKIEENRLAEFMEAVDAIFPAFDNINQLNIVVESPVDTVYEVTNSTEHLGYCIKVLPKGFDGKIELIVGVDMTGTVLGVQIVSHSETPGLGSRVADEEYLEGYTGLQGNIRLNYDIDAVAGATVTSKAVLTGVNAALAIEGLFDTGGTE